MLLSLEIEIVEALADGASFGEAGAYERVIAVARGDIVVDRGEMAEMLSLAV